MSQRTPDDLRRVLVEAAERGSVREVEAALAELRSWRAACWGNADRHRLRRDFADSPLAPRGVDEL